MENLKAILEKEKIMLENLLEVLEKQREYMMNEDSFALDKIVNEIKEKSVNLAKVEKERRELLQGENIKEVVFKSDDKSLQKVFEEVSKLVESIAIRQESNELLIKQSLVYTNKMLALLNPQKAASTYTGYGKLKR